MYQFSVAKSIRGPEMNRRLRRKLRIGAHLSVEKSARVGKIALIVLSGLILLIVLTVIWGNSLRKKAEESKNGDNTEPIGETDSIGMTDADGGRQNLPLPAFDPAKVPVINGEYIILSSSRTIDWDERASELKMKGTSAVSLILYYTEGGRGVLNFSSKTAQALSEQAANNSKANLFEVTGVLDIAGIYTSGCFYINYTSMSTPALISIYRSYEAALVAEAAHAGFSDILLFGFNTDEAAAKEAARFIGAVRELEKNSLIGIAIPAAAVKSPEAEPIFAGFAAVAEFLALDLSKVKNQESLMTELEGASGYIKKYNLRLVLPESLADSVGALAEAGYKNWQLVP